MALEIEIKVENLSENVLMGACLPPSPPSSPSQPAGGGVSMDMLMSGMQPFPPHLKTQRTSPPHKSSRNVDAKYM